MNDYFDVILSAVYIKQLYMYKSIIIYSVTYISMVLHSECDKEKDRSTNDGFLLATFGNCVWFDELSMPQIFTKRLL